MPPEKTFLSEQQIKEESAKLEENLNKESDPDKKKEIAKIQPKEVLEDYSKKVVTQQIIRTEDDPEIKKQVTIYAEFLGSDPRSLKRFSNMLRFYASYQYLRMTLGEPYVQVKALAKWLAIMLRFPKMVRWIQWEDDIRLANQKTPKEKAAVVDGFSIKVCKNGNWENEYKQWLEQDAKLLIPSLKQNESSIKYLDEGDWLKSKIFFQIIQKDFENDSLLENALKCNVW